ncbi:excisionase family DNA-binding protein [Gottfriedia acidiceleris]|uniref:excisionase family DNA-binding protein n=1 Tax=Gottfriedia acidiceleris TaxID=371036 RepID=UPI00101B808D|nr:excisionase family DNA-binding protein [Gottfriedia acidiceleris]
MESINELPIILTAENVANILSCTKSHVYEMMERTDFPLIRIGRLKRVNRDQFFNWLNNQK